MDIEELLRRLFGLKYKPDGDRYEFHLIAGAEKQRQVEDAVKGWAIHQDANQVLIQKEKETAELHNKIGALEAKVFAYEAIISNSNFKPLITRPEEGIQCNT